MANKIAVFFGYCLLAIILSVVANSMQKKGKKFKTPLIVGIVLYALALLGSVAANKDMQSAAFSVIGIVVLVVVLIILKSRDKKVATNNPSQMPNVTPQAQNYYQNTNVGNVTPQTPNYNQSPNAGDVTPPNNNISQY